MKTCNIGTLLKNLSPLDELDLGEIDPSEEDSPGIEELLSQGTTPLEHDDVARIDLIPFDEVLSEHNYHEDKEGVDDPDCDPLDTAQPQRRVHKHRSTNRSYGSWNPRKWGRPLAVDEIITSTVGPEGELTDEEYREREELKKQRARDLNNIASRRFRVRRNIRRVEELAEIARLTIRNRHLQASIKTLEGKIAETRRRILAVAVLRERGDITLPEDPLEEDCSQAGADSLDMTPSWRNAKDSVACETDPNSSDFTNIVK